MSMLKVIYRLTVFTLTIANNYFKVILGGFNFTMHTFLIRPETVSNDSNVCITSEINMYKPTSNCRRKDKRDFISIPT